MAWDWRGFLRGDAKHPTAGGICDRCGMRWNLDKLDYQFQWAGPRLQNLHFRVCPKCDDIPDEHLRPIITPPDPLPVNDPRPRNYVSTPSPPPPPPPGNLPTWDYPGVTWDEAGVSWDMDIPD